MGLLLWFVLGPGGLREAPGAPGEGPRRALGGLPEPPGARVKKPKNPYFLHCPIEWSSFWSARVRFTAKTGPHTGLEARPEGGGDPQGSGSCQDVPSGPRAPATGRRSRTSPDDPYVSGCALNTNTFLGRTYERILDFSFWDRTRNRHEMAL
jgi:hypothetical protein